MWPGDPGGLLADLVTAVAARLDGIPVPLARLADVPAVLASTEASTGAGRAALLLFPDAAGPSDGSTTTLDSLASIVRADDVDVVAVVGDGFIGTDGPAITSALLAAATVSAVRSIGVRRDVRCANAVCVPESFFGSAGTQRGPLPVEVDVSDVAEAVLLFLGDEGTYLSGQVLFVDGGRHLFSSLTA